MSPSHAEPSNAAQARILRALDEASAKLEAMERARTDPIAVIGLGCRFPGGVDDAASFWKLLRGGVDAVTEIPPDRPDLEACYDSNPGAPGKINSRAGGFLERLDLFDAGFFGLSPREAAAMDPQQRLLLEVAHEALESAGQLSDRLGDNPTGVFVGLTSCDYSDLLKAGTGARAFDPYFVSGNTLNAAAGRISYRFGLRGPCVALDTACSSSLVSIHLACQSLRSRECALALAGGVNVILAPGPSLALASAKMLAAGGRCRAFDASADGYVRSEGCGLVVLKRFEDARRDRDPILGLILGSAVNHGGPSSGFTVPSGAAQRALLQAALAQARLAPSEVDYIEAHGTGTVLGDPIEIHALADVLGEGRPADRPLLVGSVKSNLGHCESAAGVAGLIKTLLSLWHGEIPPHLHFQRPNPHISWKDLPVRIPTRHDPWPAAPRPRRAGVSAFGVSGTNAHIILAQAPPEQAALRLPAPRRRFRGERHWIGPRGTGGAVLDDAFYEVAWEEKPRLDGERTAATLADPGLHGQRVQSWLASAGPHPGGAAYAGVAERLEALSRLYARAALRTLGAAEVAPGRRRLYARAQVLAEEANGDSDEPAAAAARLRAECPEAEAEIALLARCGGRLEDVLRGGCDPLNLLFPQGEEPTAADLYEHTPAARRMNELVRAAVAALLPGAGPGRPLRVLEIGAGTGGTTSAVLPALPAGATDYAFTDVSPVFVAQARARFSGRPGVRFQVLDIERDPLAQGFGPGEFDLVIAANVLHATRDLRAALRHARALLAEGGRLVLLEATEPMGFLDLIFGLTDGWWHFSDADLRPAYPLLPPRRWREALEQTGFGPVESYSFSPEGGAVFSKQSVIVAAAKALATEGAAAGRWLLLADAGGVARALGAALERDGGVCQVMPWREGGDPPGLGAPTGGASWRGVVDLRALGAAEPSDAPPLRDALLLAQALAEKPAPLWLVTRGAAATGPADTVAGVAQAGLWGFARTLAREHPELRPVCVDLDPASATDEAAARLAAELRLPDREDQIAWRGSRRLVARLRRAALAGGTAPLSISPDGTYLIVGGLGGLGRPLARWLAARGARHLVLASRRAPDEAGEALVRDLADAGTDARLERADAAVESDLARVLATIAASPWPLRGVIHAAGVLDDGIVRQLTWDRFARVLAPKVAGAWHLHRLTRALPLDHFVLFSSAAALLGAPGQANHAAANAFLDALAHHRRAAGLPATSIDWGAWAEIGAVAERQLGARFRAKGFGEILPDDGWSALERLLLRGVTQAAVMPVDWAAVPAAFTRSPFFSELRAPVRASDGASDGSAGLDGVLATLPEAARRTRLVAEVRRLLAGVLGLDSAAAPDPQQGFFTLGMDSLTAVELRNRLQGVLGRPLPSTVVFDYPTAEALAGFLASLWEGGRSLVRGGADEEGGANEEPAARAAERKAPAANDGDEPIAVIGVGLRFPGGADSPDSFWRLLCDRVDAVAEVPADRWSLDEFYDPDPGARGKISARGGGFIDGVDQFDAGFFGVSPREAVAMDPQQRLLLEVCWEALEDAGIAPDGLAASATGVFAGICNQDYTERLLAAGPAEIDSYVGSGNAHSVAAGRVSYTLGLHGPSLAIDTACSSSLVSVHLACQSLRAGECGLALAGGVNLLLSPTISINHSRARMLAPDGRCKSFDAAADGFGRSDGCGMVVLKRLADARRDNDRVLAVIRGSAVNQDGRTSGLTVPNGLSQQAVLRAALARARAAPAEVGYVEAHGTGTALGDPIEVGAIAGVFGPNRDADSPLHVGSVKTNLGHCESAAGVAGLIKAVLAVARGRIPAHLHFRNPNPLIPWGELPWLKVPTEEAAWPCDGGPRLAGVSSFGFGGTNAHVLVGEAPAGAAETAAPRGGEILALSARSDGALRALAGRYGTFFERTEAAWADVCHTAALGRARFSCRLVASAAGRAEASKMLADFALGAAPSGLWTGTADGSPRIAFLFSGQGSLYAGMGRQLYADNEVYRTAFDACAALVRLHAGWSLTEAIDSPERLSRTEFGQVALFAVEFALCRMWQSWGVRPNAVVGHSVGEYAAACIAGALALEQALPLLIVRARLMGALGEGGAMAAVTGTGAGVAGVMAKHGVELGAVNSPRQVVLTGGASAIADAIAELKAAGLRAQRLDVKQGYHSRQMEPMLAEFGGAVEKIIPDGGGRGRAPDSEVRFISTVEARPVTGELGTAAYWVRQVRQPVRFADAMTALRGEGIDLLLEVGPRDILAALGQQTWPAGEGAWLASLRPGRTDWAQMQESAGRAWALGAPVDWRQVDRGFERPRAALPTYPFQRRRYWCAEPPRTVAAPTYEVVWEPQAPKATTRAASAGVWRLVGGSPALRRELTRELARRGHATAETPGARVQGVAFLADNPAGADPAKEAAAACERLRLLVGELVAAESPGALWIVTRGAVAALPADGNRLNLAAAPLWGFGKALALEHPEFFGGCIDLAAAAAPDEPARVVELWLSPTGEDQLALRGPALLAARLQPRTLPLGKARVRADGIYLVSGGLGALGLRAAAWLAAQGARRLVLLGRRPPSPAAETEIARLRASGVDVATQRMDVADGPGVRRLVAGLPALRGVIHAAGVPGFAPVEKLDGATLAAVLHPKLGGAWALHEATQGVELDFFAMFSSISSAWGSKGQAHYAAANQFLDALAHHRRALGLPGLSVNWGPWEGGGMASDSDRDLLARVGVKTLAPAEALATLGSALAAGATHLVAARVDWERFCAVFASRGPRPLLTRMVGTGAGPPAADSSRRAEVAALSEPERLERLRTLTQAVVARVLRLPEGELPSVRLGFADMGVDSLLAVEIRNRLGAELGLALPATLVFDHPEIERLARFLGAQFAPPPTAAEPAESAVAGLAEARNRIAAMSEADAERLLLQKLQQL